VLIREYADFCKSQLEKTEQTQKQIKKLYEQKNNVIIKSEEELVKAISNLKGEDKADLERELKDYQKYVKARETEAKKLARAEEASAKKILAQKKRDEAETARLIEKSRKDEERAFKQREAQRKREIRQLDELKQRVLTWSSIAITYPYYTWYKKGVSRLCRISRATYKRKSGNERYRKGNESIN